MPLFRLCCTVDYHSNLYAVRQHGLPFLIVEQDLVLGSKHVLHCDLLGLSACSWTATTRSSVHPPLRQSW